jgi:hypothetical protein
VKQLKPVRGATLPSKPHGVLRGYMKKQNTIESFDVKKKKADAFCFHLLYVFVCFCLMFLFFKLLKKGGYFNLGGVV